MSNIEAILLQSSPGQAIDSRDIATGDSNNVVDNFKNLLAPEKAEDKIVNESKTDSQDCSTSNFSPATDIEIDDNNHADELLPLINNIAVLNETARQKGTLNTDKKPILPNVNESDIEVNADLAANNNIIVKPKNGQNDSNLGKNIKSNKPQQVDSKQEIAKTSLSSITLTKDPDKELLQKSAVAIKKLPLQNTTKHSLLSNKTTQHIQEIVQKPLQNKSSFDEKNNLKIQEKIASFNKTNNNLAIGEVVPGDFEGKIKPVNEISSLKDKIILSQDNNDRLVITFKENILSNELIKNNNLMNLSEQFLQEQIQKEQLLKQVSLSVRQAISSNKSEVKINMHPESLGSITVKIEFNDIAKSQINNIEIMTNNRDSLNILKTASGDLKDSLSKFDNNKSFDLKFTQADDNDFNNTGQQNQQNNNSYSFEEWNNWIIQVAKFANNTSDEAKISDNLLMAEDTTYHENKINRQIISDDKIDILV